MKIMTALFEQRDHRRDRQKAYRAILTATGQPANGQVVTIGGKTYTFQTALTNVDGNVFIGATLTVSLANLLNAMNLGAGAGTAYAALTTPNKFATAQSSDATHLTVIARKKGPAGQVVFVSTNVTGATWGSVNLIRI